jgi:hypothetical protein
LPESYTKFKKDHERLDREDLRHFVEIINETFKLTLYGMDLLIGEETGDIYLIDINYMSSF